MGMGASLFEYVVDTSSTLKLSVTKYALLLPVPGRPGKVILALSFGPFFGLVFGP